MSESALAIGRRLFDECPLIGTAVFRPTFLHFNGHTLDLPDESVDRIVCFDSFHHVPNPAEVIAEFGRVLKMGGIAGFSEPGRFHSRSPQSQYEMAHHKVLENDIRIEDIFAMATGAGFTDLRTVVSWNQTMSLADYLEVVAPLDNGKEAVPCDAYRTAALAKSIFFLHKGPLLRDSRSHEGLAHRMSCDVSHPVLQ